MLGDDGDDVVLLEVERGLVARGEVGQRLHVVVLAAVRLEGVRVQKVLDLAWKGINR